MHLLAAEVLRYGDMGGACMVRLSLLGLSRQEADLLLPIRRLGAVLIQIVVVVAL